MTDETNNTNNSKENNLATELKKANKTIEDQKKIINDLNNKIKEYENNINYYNDNIKNFNKIINNYKNIIIEKDKELNDIKLQLNYKANLTNVDDIKFKDIMCVHFISSDKKVLLAVPCYQTNIFADIEEKLYQKYPEYRETNNNFIVNGKNVLRFKTIEENKINDDLQVTLVIPS